MAQPAQPAHVDKVVSINGIAVDTDQPPDLQDVEAACRDYETNREVFQGLTRGLYRAQDESEVLVSALEKVVKKQKTLSRQVNAVAFHMIAKQNNQKDIAVQRALAQARVETDSMLADSVQQVTNEFQSDVEAKQGTIDQKEKTVNPVHRRPRPFIHSNGPGS